MTGSGEQGLSEGRLRGDGKGVKAERVTKE